MNVKLPSTVTDEDYITIPEGNVIDDDKEYEKCGMWILPVPEYNLSWANDVWTDLQKLLNNGCLIRLKASTAAFKESGVIFCYTRPGQEEARKTAEAIRETIRYKYKNVMLYKSLKNTKDQRRFGVKHVSHNMHTFLGGFYARDANRRWKLVGEPRIIRKKPVFLKSTIARAHTPLPSSQDDRFPHRMRKIEFDRNSDTGDQIQIANGRRFHDKREIRKRYFRKVGFWQFKCSLEVEEGGLTEADRVWLAVKRLYDQGSFVNIISVSDFEIKITNIFCYVSDYSDVRNLINDCKYILRNAHFSTMSNFFILTSCSDYFLKYVLTPEEELYEEERKLTTIKMVLMKFLSEEELLKKI